MKAKFGICIVLLFALTASSLYIDAPAVKTQYATCASRQTQKAAVQNSISCENMPCKAQVPAVKTQPAAAVLKQVTQADMLSLDLGKPCGFTADELEGVTKYSLSGFGACFAQQDQKVNAVFLMAVAALESGWGRYQLTKYNLFGMYHFYPQSYAGSISGAADHLRNDYLSQSGRWFHGCTVSAVNTDYCVNSDGSPKTSWADQVSRIMADMYNQIYSSEYSRAQQG